MNTVDILKYGDRTLLKSLSGFSEDDYYKSGACGYWSIKEIIAHLASFELMLDEAISSVTTGNLGQILTAYLDNHQDFNDQQVSQRANLRMDQTLQQYKDAHRSLMTTAAEISDSLYRQNGTIPWYGDEYCLNDLIVYSNYGHKREHSAQVNAFRDILYPPT